MEYKKILTNRLGIFLVAVLSCTLWGSAFPVLKISFTEMQLIPANALDKTVFAGMRFLLASCFIFIFCKVFLRVRLINHSIKNKIGFKVILLGLFQTSLLYYFFYNGLAYTTGMKGAVLSSIGSFFVVIFAHFLYRNDRMNYKKGLGLLLGFAGILFVNWGKEFSWVFSFRGEGYMIISGLVSAVGTLLAKELSKESHPFLITAWQMFIGSLFLLLFGWSRVTAVIMKFTPLTVILFIYAAFLSATAFSLWYALLKYNKAGEVTLYKFLIPVSGTILSTLFIPGEKLTLSMFVGLLFVSMGILMINLVPGITRNSSD